MKDELSQYKDDTVGRIAALPQDKQTLLGQSLKQKLADGHTLVAQTLKRLGIRHVYCVSGTPIRETFAKCGELGIRLISLRHHSTPNANIIMRAAEYGLSTRFMNDRKRS